ncbi:MAG: sugar ABC transporter substrate-binding protein [Clostridia bacterium]|nr:sugar ABC transporter substrate-binding protein [Clostridia bacterium]
MLHRIIHRTIAISLATLLAAGLAACRPQDQTGETLSAGTNAQPVIGFAMDTLVIERWESDRNIFVSAVNAQGGEVIVQNANGSSEEQENQIRYLIKKSVDVLVIVAIDEKALGDEIQLARERGIHVIAYDRMIHQTDLDFYISFDSAAVGELMARALVRQNPRGRYILMNGSAEDWNSALIRKGIDRVFAEYPTHEILREMSATNWSADDAYAKFRQILDTDVEFDGILCGNDALAGAAVRALALYRKSGDIAVTGQDADLDACQRIVEGTQLMTVYKPIGTLAKAAADAAMALARGDSPTANDTIDVDGVQIPYARLTPVSVNRSNIDEVIIASGFHSQKDVYRNVSQDQWPRQG